MKPTFGNSRTENKIIGAKKRRGNGASTVHIAVGAMILWLVFLSGCGVFRRGERIETPALPPVVTQVAPTAAQPTSTVAPSQTAAPVVPTPTQTSRPPAASQATATPTRAAPTASAPGPSAGGIAIGVYQPQPDASGKAIDKYTEAVGKKPAFAWQPMTWQRPDGSFVSFDRQILEEYRTRGVMPGLTWEPSRGPAQRTGANQPDFSWKQISSGKYDAYITQFAKDAAAYHYPFILRVLHEMDGTWYPWGYSVNGNTNLADYVSAYKHIVDLFRAAGATNVQFVWNPSVVGQAAVQQYGALLKQAYPGDNYVDWVALDGYNSKVGEWQSLQDVFQPSYQLITSFSKRPMILFEVGTLENPQDPKARANWITQGFLTTIPNQFPDVKVVVWFNSEDGSGRDFSLKTPEDLNAWKQVASSPLYQGTLLK